MIDLFTSPPPPPDSVETSRTNDAISVSELSRRVKGTIENNFGEVRVQGEISGFKRPKQSHCYMHLKDKDSVVKAIIWQSVFDKMGLDLKDGDEVIVTGKLTTYCKFSSEYQIFINHVEIAGIGVLLQQIEELRRKLEAEGLFSDERKKTLPLYPRSLGIITSETGSVIKDILRALEERLALDIYLYSANVQGEKSAGQVCNGIGYFNKRGVDVIIIARGGGSIEDLKSFNDEALVRAVANSEIPIVSAVGHETDTKLVDYAADVRVSTPTAAAGLVVKLKSEARDKMLGHFGYINKSMNNLLSHLQIRMREHKLPPPFTLLDLRQQRLNGMAEGLKLGLKDLQRIYQTRLGKLAWSLKDPRDTWRANGEVVKRFGDSLANQGKEILARKRTDLETASRLLETSSYKKTMERGFAIIRTENKGVHSSAETLQNEDNVSIIFHDSEVGAVIKKP